MINILNFIISFFGYRIEISDTKCGVLGCKHDKSIGDRCVYHHLQSSND